MSYFDDIFRGCYYCRLTEMIKELSQPMGLEIPIIDVGGASMTAVDVAEGSSLPGDSRETISYSSTR